MLPLNDYIIHERSVLFKSSFKISYYPESKAYSKKNMDLDMLSCFSDFIHIFISLAFSISFPPIVKKQISIPLLNWNPFSISLP